MTPSPSTLPNSTLCRDCFTLFSAQSERCTECSSRRTISHPELQELSIAHVDCDAFFAAVEKRDNPDLKDKPVIIGGGDRGVVSTACYIARMNGVRSAMPMFKARKLCPDAVIIHGNMHKYKEASLQITRLFNELTPSVEPLSIDEAFLDLTGTSLVHQGDSGSIVLAKLAKKIEQQVGISISIGLSYNKFLAKVASDMDKPRGFTIIGHSDAKQRLAELPINRIPGIGKVTENSLEKKGLTMISQLQTMSERDLAGKFGETGLRLYRLSRGIDNRIVKKERKTKSVSGETTFRKDIWEYTELETLLWKQCERVSKDLKKKNLAATTVTLKLKTSHHKTLSRSHTLDGATQMATILFEKSRHMLKPLCDGTYYRLIGVGGSNLTSADFADQPDLIEPKRNKLTDAEKAIDQLRDRFGDKMISKGRSFK
ncbi:DNA polymerase IV [Temperatibacter marinus]|uniref:DNA polymerase IV n=1 Tax=Temperatibacter marinus TaxID=1456591 RepID=A0AA52EI47_9PROT|nr:DNA polymerase IV [Temperatibacter marinus]WND02471.1 DNA polymerase IV [Temperatibacter marinus]